MHKELIKKIFEKGNREDIDYLKSVMVTLIDNLKINDKEQYDQIEYTLYCKAYGEHLTEELAKKWVSHMKNKDGTVGEHWTYEQTSQYAGKYDKWDWYAILNSVYSDYFTPKYSTEDYLTMANDFISDTDAQKGKVLKYYWFIAEH